MCVYIYIYIYIYRYSIDTRDVRLLREQREGSLTVERERVQGTQRVV